MVSKQQLDDQQTGVEGEECEPVFEHRQSTEEAQNRTHYNWRSTTRHNSRHCAPPPGARHPPTHYLAPTPEVHVRLTSFLGFATPSVHIYESTLFPKKIVLCRLLPALGILPPLPPAEAECRPWQSAAAPLLHLLPCHPSTNSGQPSSNKVIYAWNGSCLLLAPIHRVDHPLNSDHDQPPPAK